jgi:hypothetical protein
MIEKLDESNILLFAAKHYNNTQCCDTVEFYEDLNRFKYIKRLLNKYQETGDLKERLILNHLTVLYNVFGVDPTTRMLFVKLQSQYHLIKPFLVLLGTLPITVCNIGILNETIFTEGIPSDKHIEKMLEKL